MSRVNELHNLRKAFCYLRDTAACVGCVFPELCLSQCSFSTNYAGSEVMQLFVDCLLALPNLHTLEIAPTSLPLGTLFGNVSKSCPQYQSVHKRIHPSGAYPNLQCLPNTRALGSRNLINSSQGSFGPTMANTGTSFKRFKLIGGDWTGVVGKGKLYQPHLAVQSLTFCSPELFCCIPNARGPATRKVNQSCKSDSISQFTKASRRNPQWLIWRN